MKRLLEATLVFAFLALASPARAELFPSQAIEMDCSGDKCLTIPPSEQPQFLQQAIEANQLTCSPQDAALLNNGQNLASGAVKVACDLRSGDRIILDPRDPAQAFDTVAKLRTLATIKGCDRLSYALTRRAPVVLPKQVPPCQVSWALCATHAQELETAASTTQPTVATVVAPAPVNMDVDAATCQNDRDQRWNFKTHRCERVVVGKIVGATGPSTGMIIGAVIAFLILGLACIALALRLGGEMDAHNATKNLLRTVRSELTDASRNLADWIAIGDRLATIFALPVRTENLNEADDRLVPAATKLREDMDCNARTMGRNAQLVNQLTAERDALATSLRERTDELATAQGWFTVAHNRAEMLERAMTAATRMSGEALDAVHQRMVESLAELGITVRGQFDGPLEAIVAMHLALADHYRQARGALAVANMDRDALTDAIAILHLDTQFTVKDGAVTAAKIPTDQIRRNATDLAQRIAKLELDRAAEYARAAREFQRAERLQERASTAETALYSLRNNRTERLGLLGITCHTPNGHVAEDLLEQFRLLDGERDAVQETCVQMATMVDAGFMRFLILHAGDLTHMLEHPRCSKDSRRGKPAHAARKQAVPLLRQQLDHIARATGAGRTALPVAATAAA